MADPAGDSDVLPAQDKVKFTEAGALPSPGPDVHGQHKLAACTQRSSLGLRVVQ